MNEEDLKIWTEFKLKVTNKLTQPQYKQLCKLHAKYFNHKYYEPCSCRPIELRQWISDLNKLYDKC